MIDIDKYEDAKKMVEDAGLIDDNDGWLDVHYRKIALLLAEVKRLRMYEVAWKMLYYNAIEEGRETRTRTWKEIMELVRSDVREMVDTEDGLFDEWLKGTGGFE